MFSFLFFSFGKWTGEGFVGIWRIGIKGEKGGWLVSFLLLLSPEQWLIDSYTLAFFFVDVLNLWMIY